MPDLTTARNILVEINNEFDLDGSVTHHDEGLASVSLHFTRETGIECALNIWIEDDQYAVEANVWKDDPTDATRYWTHLTPTLVATDLLQPTIEAKVQEILGMGEWDLTYEKDLQQNQHRQRST